MAGNKLTDISLNFNGPGMGMQALRCKFATLEKWMHTITPGSVVFYHHHPRNKGKHLFSDCDTCAKKDEPVLCNIG